MNKPRSSAAGLLAAVGAILGGSQQPDGTPHPGYDRGRAKSRRRRRPPRAADARRRNIQRQRHCLAPGTGGPSRKLRRAKDRPADFFAAMRALGRKAADRKGARR
jgi:hypothetical protein